MENEKQLWSQDFEEKVFEFMEREARIVYPKTAAKGKLVLKAEYFESFPGVDIELLNRGYHICFLKTRDRWGADTETAVLAEFVKFVAKELGLEEKCAVTGMSCGGLKATRLAELYPELISVLYLDAPVLNILSVAGLGAKTHHEDSTWQELVNTYGFSKSTVINFRKSPIDKMDVLIEHNIPIIMVYGNADTTVVYSENGQVLEDYYREHNGILKVIPKTMCYHHPHGLENPEPICDFIEKYI